VKPTSRSFIHKTIASGLIAMACFVLTTRIMAQSLSTEGIVKLASSTMEYFSQGKGEAIVLLPGGTLTVGYLDAMAATLAAQGYRVVGINFRGSGKSTGPSEGVTLQTNADDVAGVIKALDIGPVHIVGNDFGNRVARMVAASHPELIRSVILLAAGGKIRPKPEALHALEVIFNPASTETEVLAEMKYLVANQADAARVWEILNASRDPQVGAIEEAASKATPLAAWWAPPGNTRYLILQGADDQLAPPENGVELQKELGARATLVNVPSAAHMLPVELPAVAASHIVEFVKSVGKAP
jgi:pimeloyl-ACP methyl ester carboxylesterase